MTTKWIDLGDASGARLKLASINVQGTPTLHIFITGMAFTNPKWGRAIKELGFNAPASRKYLVRRVEPGEKLVASRFHAVFPSARLVPMLPEQYMLNLSSKASSPKADEQSADVDMRGVKRLGRNEAGLEVYDSLSGRFYEEENGKRVLETDSQQPHLFLRLAKHDQPAPQGAELKEALRRVSMGFVRAMDMGEVQHSEDYDAFKSALFPVEAPADVDDILSSAIDSAMLQFVRQGSDVPTEAFSPMARLYDFLPPYRGKRRGDGVIPAPLSIAAQRLLGDTAEKVVVYPNAFDGASFAFLPRATKVRAYRGQEGVVDLSEFAATQEGVTWLGRYTAASESGADALFFNADPIIDGGARRDYVDALQALRGLSAGARAIVVLAADSENAAGRVNADSGGFLQALAARCSIEDVFETAPILTRKSGGSRGLRVYSLRNIAPSDREAQRVKVAAWLSEGVPVLSSWDQVKAHIDETIQTLALKEAETEAVDLERAAANESYQRPYLAFSKVGEARAMVPANQQAPIQSYLTRLEQAYGPVDEFVMNQLGMGRKTLEANFSPEQVDAIAIEISRMLVGRSSIVADDTGLGKGRQLAALATWANKRVETVVFVTEKANLFSDLARDLKHIGEWDRFRPLILNSDGEITYEESPGAEPTVLTKGLDAATMRDILENNRSMEELQVNMVFLTYSQISTAESAKAVWVKNQLANSLVLFDEAHVAAGSDSNIALQVDEMATLAKHVIFSSATWSKTHDNMHIYQRAFPPTVAVATLSETMRKGGDSFSELFSSMLAAEGSLIRREHDLSKLEVEMVVDDANRAVNEDVSDKVADVLGSASYISGDMQQVFIRANAQSVAKLKGARDVRSKLVKAKLFSSSFGAGSVIYQVMKSVQGTLNAPHVAKLAIESVSRGMKPVIISDATGETIVEALIENIIRENGGGRPETIRIPTLQDMLRHVIYRKLATIRVEEVTPADVAEDDAEGGAPPEEVLEDGELAALPAPEGAAATEAPADAELEAAPEEVAEEGVDVQAAFVTGPATAQAVAPVVTTAELDAAGVQPRGRKGRRKRVFKDVPISELTDIPQQAAERYAEGLKEIEEKIQLVPPLPVISFDVMAQMLRDAGISVAEISGRKHMLVRQGADNDQWRLVPRAKSKKAVKATIRSFNNGGTSVVILNRAAAAGVSMHSSPRFLDQSRRHVIEHQIQEDPVVRVQLLGRANRYDQLSTPLVTSASTGIYGEVRYLMVQNRKLARMSANVRSSRDNAMNIKGIVDLFNSVGKQACLSYLQDNPLVAKRLGITDYDLENNPDIVNKLTMRIPLLRVQHQEVVYEDIYSRYDEILLRAEMDGQNPLRPNELDIRAATVDEMVFFGDDSPVDEFTSAFDAPVMARRIKWEQMRNPLSFTAVKEAAKVNVERLRASGYLEPAAQSSNALKVNGDLVKKVVGGFHSLTRLAHTATDFEKYEDAVTKAPGPRRQYLKYVWIKDNLPKLIPGEVLAVYGLDGSHEERFKGECTVITDVQPPSNEADLLDAGKWKITVVTSGDEKPRSYSLRSLLSAMDGAVGVGEITGDLKYSLFGPSFRHSENILLEGERDARGRVTTPEWYFDTVPRGKRKHEATVLSGNMYLAAEWAAATKKGNSAIYTDETGFRNRIIMLDKEVGHLDPQYLPVRVSDPAAITKFMLPLAAAPEAGAPADPALHGSGAYVLDTSFKSAMAAAEGGVALLKRDAVLAVQPGAVIAVSCSPKDVRRIKAALTTGQVALRRSLLGPASVAADDAHHVVVRSFSTVKDLNRLGPVLTSAMRNLQVSRTSGVQNLLDGAGAGDGGGSGKASKVAVLTLDASTPEKAKRSIELIRRYSGLELYVTGESLKQRAREAIRDVLVERRAEARARQEELRATVLQSASPVSAPAAESTDDKANANLAENDIENPREPAETVR